MPTYRDVLEVMQSPEVHDFLDPPEPGDLRRMAVDVTVGIHARELINTVGLLPGGASYHLTTSLAQHRATQVIAEKIGEEPMGGRQIAAVNTLDLVAADGQRTVRFHISRKFDNHASTLAQTIGRDAGCAITAADVVEACWVALQPTIDDIVDEYQAVSYINLVLADQPNTLVYNKGDGHFYAVLHGDLLARGATKDEHTFMSAHGVLEDPPPHPSTLTGDALEEWYEPDDLRGADRLRVLLAISEDEGTVNVR